MKRQKATIGTVLIRFYGSTELTCALTRIVRRSRSCVVSRRQGLRTQVSVRTLIFPGKYTKGRRPTHRSCVAIIYNTNGHKNKKRKIHPGG